MNTLISHIHTLISEDVFLSRAVPLLVILSSVIMITWFVFFVLDQNHNIPDEYDFIGEVDVKWGKIVRVKYRCPQCHAVVSTRTIRKHMPCPECGCELYRLKEE